MKFLGVLSVVVFSSSFSNAQESIERQKVRSPKRASISGGTTLLSINLLPILDTVSGAVHQELKYDLGLGVEVFLIDHFSLRPMIRISDQMVTSSIYTSNSERYSVNEISYLELGLEPTAYVIRGARSGLFIRPHLYYTYFGDTDEITFNNGTLIRRNLAQISDALRLGTEIGYLFSISDVVSFSASLGFSHYLSNPFRDLGYEENEFGVSSGFQEAISGASQTYPVVNFSMGIRL